MTLREQLAPYFADGGALFELPAANALGSEAIERLIEDHLPPDPPDYPSEPTLRVEQCGALQGEDPVRFDGRALLARGQADRFDVEVTFATVAGVVQVAVASKPLSAAWGFGATFPALADSALAELRFGDARFALASLDDPVLGDHPAGLSFGGTPSPGGPLDQVAWLFATLPRVAGTIALEGDAPRFALSGMLSATVALGALTLQPGLRLEALPPPEGDAATVVALAHAFAELTVGSGAGAKRVRVVTALSVAPLTLQTYALEAAAPLDGYGQLDTLAGGSVDVALAAAPLPGSAQLTLDGLSLTVATGAGSVELASVTATVALAPETPWPLLPRDVLTANELRAAFTIERPLEAPRLHALVGATFAMDFGGDDVVGYDLSVALPELVVQGGLAQGDTIPLDRLVAKLLGPFVPAAAIPPLEVYALDLLADARNGSFSFNAGLAVGWTILELADVAIVLEDLNVLVDYEEAGVSLVAIAGWRLVFDPTAPDGALEFDVQAAKEAGADGWDVSLTQAPGSALDLMVVVQKFVGASVRLPSFLPASLKLDGLALGVQTASGDYRVAGRAVALWRLDFIPGSPPLEIEAHLDVSSTTAPQALAAPAPYALVQPARGALAARTTSGTFGGRLRVWDFELAVEYRFGSSGDVIDFSFRFRAATIHVTRTVEDREVILRGRLTGVSFGDLLELLVGLAAPGSGFRLPPPWDALYGLRFDALVLEINLTRDTVGFRYEIGLDLGFMKVTSVGLSYGRNAAGQTTVFAVLDGDFMGQPFGGRDPLTWDVLNEAPPAPSARGDQLIDLRYLGIGQNVGFRDGRSFRSVLDVIAALRDDFEPPAEGDRNPLAPGRARALTFTGDGSWLIGADFTVMGAVSIAGVFADPVLYGLRVGLAGEKVRSFSGLQFEIFYKKVTETIGVYQLELTLPSAFRQMQFGAVSLTFPIVAIDIYTNGNFRVDLGFPRARDFSRSFSVEAGPFVGAGGFYVAVLDGATSERVPVVANGAFSPVIEFGIGLSVGVGRTIDKGFLKAGLTVTLETILEGVLGWFNPDDRAQPTDVYYRVEGTAALVGKLFGAVDFVVVRAEVSVTVWASVTLVAEAYRAIELALSVGVRVTASVRILFIRIDFSFAASLDLSFTIGSDTTPPWQIVAPDGAQHPFQLRQQRAQRRERRVPPARTYAALLAAAGGPAIDPRPARVFDAPQTVPLALAPSFTLLEESGGARSVQMVLGLFVGTGEDPALRGPRRERAAPPAAALHAPFNVLARGLLRWALSWLDPLPAPLPRRAVAEVGIEQLDALAAWLADAANRRRAFRWENLDAFLGLNVRMLLSAPTSGPPTAGAALPLPPPLELLAQGRPPVRLWEQAPVTEAWEQLLHDYYAQTRLDPQAGTGTGTRPRGADAGAAAPTGGPGAGAAAQPLPELVFSDAFALIGKGVVTAARELLEAYPHKVGDGDSLAGVLREYGGEQTLELRVGEHQTLATVAARHGVAPGELRRRNPQLTVAHPYERLPAGTTVRVPAGPTLATLAEANADYPLHTGAHAPVAGVKHQVVAVDGATGGSESLADVAKAYAPYGVAGPSALMQGPAGLANAASGELLEPGATLGVPPHAHVLTPAEAAASDPAALFAARTWVRAGHAPTGPYVPWYRQRIADLNPGLTGPVPPGTTTIEVPIARAGASGIDELGLTAYQPSPGDTLDSVAASFDLLQVDAAADPGYLAFARGITFTPPLGPGSTLQVPPYPARVQAGDSLDVRAQAAGVAVEALVGANAGDRRLLRRHAVVLLPTLSYRAAPGDTLAGVAARFDLTLEELAEGASGATTMLAHYGATGPDGRPTGPLTVPHVPARDRDALEADLLAFNRLGELAGAASRFLLHGLRVPDPTATPPDPPLQGLAQTLGQQLPAPAPGATYDVGFRKGVTADWLGFTGPIGPSGQLLLRMGPTFLNAHRPGPTFDAQILSGPSAMPFARAMAPRHGLQQAIHWQAGAPVGPLGPTTLPPPAAGQPSLWPFPASLRALLAGATGPTGPYELLAAPAEVVAGGREQRLERYAWGMLVPLRLRRVPGPEQAPVPGGYVVSGADEAGRELLLSAWQWLAHAGTPGDALYLLFAPAAGGENGRGLASGALDPARTVALKTNLSTVTHANAALAADVAATAGTSFARASAPAAFLRLLWEASVTGSGGFYLTYGDETGATLPDELFRGGDEAIVQLLLVLGRQRSQDRRLLPFNTCAVLAENLDAATATLFAQLSDPQPEQLRRVPALPAGTLGMRLMRADPGDVQPAQAARSLFSLLGYQVEAGPDFDASHHSLPAGPIRALDDDWPPGPTAWHYQQLVPISRFGQVNDAPASPALPSPSANPYAGITGPAGGAGAAGPEAGARPLSRVRLALGFHDVHGNTLPPTPPLAPLDVPVGYADELIGVGAWPGAGAAYALRPRDGGIELALELTLDGTRGIAGAGVPFAQASAAARNDAARWERIFFQLQQRDVRAELTSNVGAAQLDADALKASLAGVVTTGLLLADAAAALEEVVATPSPGQTLGAFAGAYAVTGAQLAARNAELPLAQLLAGQLVVPRIVAAPQGSTLAQLAAQGTAVPWPPRCPLPPGDAPGAVAPLTPAELAERNPDAPLGPGTVLRTLRRTTRTPSDWEASSVPDTLAGVAAWLACPVYVALPDPDAPGGTAEQGIVPDNLDADGLVAPELTISLGDAVAVTDDETTLRSLHAALAAAAPDLATFARGIAEVPGIFRADAPVAHAAFTVPTPTPTSTAVGVPAFRLAQLPSGCGTAAEIAGWNRAVPGFYASGAPLCLGYACAAPDAGATLASVARDHRLPVEALGAFNAATPLQATPLTIPQLTALGADERWAGVAPGAQESLAELAARLGTTAPALAALNRELPGMLGAASVSIEGLDFPVAPLDSLESLYERCRAALPALTWDRFAEQLAPQRGVLRANGALVAPLPQVPGGLRLREVVSRFGIRAEGDEVDAIAALLRRNRTLAGFLRDGGSLRAPDGTAIAVGAHDTVETVLRRLHDEHGLTLTVHELASANADAVDVLSGGARVLLPPSPALVTAPFAPHIPPDGSSGEGRTIFPVRVELRLARAAGLVTPELAGEPSVREAVVRLTPLTGGDEDGLRRFAAELEAAFAAQRLKCAVSKPHALGPDQESGQIWAVSFGPQGIARLAIEAADPSFYALAPLATAPWTGEIQYWPYASGCGLRAPQLKRFDGADVDAWLRLLLATADRYLTTAYAVPGFAQGAQAAGPAEPADAGGCSGCTGPTGPPSGPQELDRVVDAKRRIATALSRRVVPILAGVGATASLLSARESLRQQMLVQLSAAHEVDAVLEWPVVASSPWSSGTAGPPPRVSGPVVPRLVGAPGTLPPSAFATLDALAQASGVSVAYLAELVHGRSGLLATGQTATFGSARHTIDATDTLESVAAALGVRVDFSDPAQWAAWVELIAGAGGLGGQPLVHAATGFPVSAIARELGAGDTLARVAVFTGSDVAAVGRANQDVPGIFRAGSTVHVDGIPYTVRAGETLWQIAQAMGVTVDALCEAAAVRDAVGLLAAPRLGFATLLPDATLSTAKVAVGRHGTTPPGLSVLLSLGQARGRGNAFFTLDYAINELEHAIRPVAGATGYEASSWLTFPLPIGSSAGAPVPVDTAIPQVQVPVPVRSYPDVPLLTGQHGLPAHPGATSIADAKLWSYGFDFVRRAAAQDATHVQVTFSRDASDAAAAQDDLFRLRSPLATFAEAYEALSADLATLAEQAPGGQSARGAIAAQVLSCLLTWTAQGLELLPADAVAAAAEPTYRFRMEARGSDAHLAELWLVREDGLTGATARDWPRVFMRSTTGATGDGPDAGYVPLTWQGAAGMTAHYRYPPGVPSDVPLTHRLWFDERDIVRDTRGVGGVWLSRNDALIASGPLGPTGSTRPYATNPAFVYRTPDVAFIDPLVPTLATDAPIDIAALSDGRRLPLHEHLLALLEHVLELSAGVGGWLQLACDYAYPAAGDDGGIWARTPVRLLPTLPIAPGQGAKVAQAVADSLFQWTHAQGAVRPDGRFAFALTVFTPTDENEREAAAAARRPVPPVRGDRLERALMARICLSMIVKDEASVIARCLESVRPLIDAWAIVDTGSSDGTQEIVRRCLGDLPGTLVERPWVDFAHNRSEALELARGAADYTFVIDADEVLEARPGAVAAAVGGRLLHGRDGLRRLHLPAPRARALRAAVALPRRRARVPRVPRGGRRGVPAGDADRAPPRRRALARPAHLPARRAAARARADRRPGRCALRLLPRAELSRRGRLRAGRAPLPPPRGDGRLAGGGVVRALPDRPAAGAHGRAVAGGLRRLPACARARARPRRAAVPHRPAPPGGRRAPARPPVPRCGDADPAAGAGAFVRRAPALRLRAGARVRGRLLLRRRAPRGDRDRQRAAALAGAAARAGRAGGAQPPLQPRRARRPAAAGRRAAARDGGRAAARRGRRARRLRREPARPAAGGGRRVRVRGPRARAGPPAARGRARRAPSLRGRRRRRRRAARRRRPAAARGGRRAARARPAARRRGRAGGDPRHLRRPRLRAALRARARRRRRAGGGRAVRERGRVRGPRGGARRWCRARVPRAPAAGRAAARGRGRRGGSRRRGRRDAGAARRAVGGRRPGRRALRGRAVAGGDPRAARRRAGPGGARAGPARQLPARHTRPAAARAPRDRVVRRPDAPAARAGGRDRRRGALPRRAGALRAGARDRRRGADRRARRPRCAARRAAQPLARGGARRGRLPVGRRRRQPSRADRAPARRAARRRCRSLPADRPPAPAGGPRAAVVDRLERRRPRRGDRALRARHADDAPRRRRALPGGRRVGAPRRGLGAAREPRRAGPDRAARGRRRAVALHLPRAQHLSARAPRADGGVRGAGGRAASARRDDPRRGRGLRHAAPARRRRPRRRRLRDPLRPPAAGRRAPGAYASSTTASPWPTPMHSVATPQPPPRRRSSWAQVASTRAPEAPSGWPIAIAPPSTFTRSGSSCGQAARQASDCAANASLSSSTDTSSQPMPAALSARSTACTGPIPNTSGSTPETPRPAIRASGSRPIAAAARSSPISTAAAPSFSAEALPAVTVPLPSRRKAGFSFASASSELSGRMISSRVSSVSGTGTTQSS